jgi:hypothetical protein
MKTSSPRPYIFIPKITVRICALAVGSDPGVECETRAAGVAIKKIRSMIFGIKIFRLDFFVTFFIKEKSKMLFNPFNLWPKSPIILSSRGMRVPRKYLHNPNQNPPNDKLMKTSSPRPYIYIQKITIRICALAIGSDPGVECETRAAGVAIRKIRSMIFSI